MAPKPPSDLLANIPSTPWSDLSGLVGGDSAPAGTSSANADTGLTPNEDKPRSPGAPKDVSADGQRNDNLKDSQNRSRGRGFRNSFSNYQRYGGRNNAGYGENRPRGYSNSNQQSGSRRNYNQRHRNFDGTNKSRQENVEFKDDYDFDKSNAELAEFLEKIDISSVS